MRPTSRATHRVLWSIAVAGLLVLVAWKALTPSAAAGGAVSALVQAPGPSPALETLTLYPDADTFVDQTSSKANFGKETELLVGMQPCPPPQQETCRQDALLHFDLTDLPSGASIESATLTLTLHKVDPPQQLEVKLYRMDTDWGEYDIVWDKYTPPTELYDGAAVGPEPGKHSWKATELVRAWVDGQSNHGLALRAEAAPEGGARAYFFSREQVQTAEGPVLEIVYALPTPTVTSTATSAPPSTSTATSTPTATPTATATRSGTPTTPDCTDSFEPNEKREEAYLLPGAGEYTAYICTPTDEDWYAADLLLGQTLHASIRELPANYDLELYSPVGTLMTSSRNAGTAMDEISFVARELVGRYALRVFGVAGAYDETHPYILKWTPGDSPAPTPTRTATATPTATPPCPADAYEPNDDFAGAAAIAAGSEVRGVLCPADDEDYFRVPVPACSEVRVRLYDLAANYQLALLDPSGVIVARAGGTGTSDRQIDYTANAAGDYRLRVTRGWGAAYGESYALGVELTPAEPQIYYPVADTMVYEGDASAVHGGDRRLVVGSDEFGQPYRAYLRFDVSDLPLGRDIGSARLVLYLNEAHGHDRPSIEVRTSLLTWREDTLTWATQPGSNPSGVSAEVGPMAESRYSWDVTDIVQGWVSRTHANYGLELRYAPEGATSWRAFASNDAGAYQPQLIIACEPEPTAPGSVSGTVYHDANGNRTPDPGEERLSGVRVDLFRDDLGRLAGATTSTDGSYSFTDISVPDEGVDTTRYEVRLDETTLDTVLEWELLSGPIWSVHMRPGDDITGVDFRLARRPTPTPPPPVTLDLVAEDIEFIQVLSEQPLVKGKATLARLYVRFSGVPGPVTGVNGRLEYGVGDYILSLGSATLEASAHARLRDDPAVVSDLTRTVNFLLPDSWTRDDEVRLVAWVNHYNPGDECAGCWNADNQIVRTITLRDAAPYQVSMVDVTVDGVAPIASHADVARWLLGTYPISEVHMLPAGLSVTGIDLTDTSGSGCGPEWAELLDRLEDVNVSEFGLYDRRYGVINWSVTMGVGWGGCGSTPGTVAAGLTRAPGWGGVTMAHETGHNLGLRHTCSAPCALEGGCVNYRPEAVLGLYGIDMANPAAPVYLDPDAHHDLMSYCGPRWMADHTYSYLLERFTGSGGLVTPWVHGDAVAPSAEGFTEYLLTRGHIDGAQVTTRPYYRITLPAGSSDGLGSGRYAIELRDAADQALFTRHFDLRGDSVEPTSGLGGFREVLPWHPGTASIVILDGDVLLHVTQVTPNTPVVTVLAPNGGEEWLPYGEQTVTWTATDADGGPLRYAVQYSADDGATWHTLDSNLAETTYTVDLAYLAGSDTARIRVLATDWVNTGMDASDGAFGVQPKPPQVGILRPAEGTRFLPGAPVVMEAIGTDLEDGPLADDARFRWRSSRQGELGQGRQLRFEDLAPGTHTLTVEVRDSDGFTSTDEVTIHVGRILALPLVRR